MPGKKGLTIEERFWAKVDRAGPLPACAPGLGRCWLWTAGVDKDGYGKFRLIDGHIRSHRWSYETARGPIPDGLVIDHVCRTPACVRPDHLEVVTSGENSLRSPIAPAAVNASKQRCVRGHIFDEANTYVTRSGHRSCRECMRQHKRNWRARHRHEAA